MNIKVWVCKYTELNKSYQFNAQILLDLYGQFLTFAPNFQTWAFWSFSTPPARYPSNKYHVGNNQD